MTEFPLSTFGKVSKKDLANMVARNLAATDSRRSAHHRPALLSRHAEWIDVAGALLGAAGAGTGRREWMAKTEDEVVAEFPRAGVEACWSRWTWRPLSATPPCTNDYVAGMCEPPSRDAFCQRVGRGGAGQGREAMREARQAVTETGLLGFHFHPIMRHFAVNDRRYYPLFEEINALGVPVMVDVGTTGMGAGMPGGNGARARGTRTRRRSTTLAADFPEPEDRRGPPGWPWVDEMTAVALHKGNVYWEMSGLGAQALPGQPEGRHPRPPAGQDHVRQRLPEPALERMLREWDELGFSAEIMEKVFHGNAERVLRLPPAARAGSGADGGASGQGGPDKGGTDKGGPAGDRADRASAVKDRLGEQR